MRTLSSITLSDKDRRAVEAAGAILREQFPVERVVLFGSKARGDDDPESDIDLLVLTERMLTWQQRDHITSALFDLQLELEVVISTLVEAAEDREEGLYQVMPVRDEINRDGAVA